VRNELYLIGYYLSFTSRSYNKCANTSTKSRDLGAFPFTFKRALSPSNFGAESPPYELPYFTDTKADSISKHFAVEQPNYSSDAIHCATHTKPYDETHSCADFPSNKI